MSSPTHSETSDEPGKLARRIEYLESQIQHLQADCEALQQQLRLAEHAGIVNKVDAINRLTHGIAHDINNLLTPIVACSHLIKEDGTASKSVLENADQLIETGERLIAVTRKLHSLFPKAAKRNQAVDLNAHVRNGVEAAKPQLGDQVSVVLELDPAAGMAQADTSLIEKMVHELCINARDAMPCGGTVTVQTRRGKMEGPGDSPEEYSILTVRDQGVGMKPDVRMRLYEPYFSTKEPTRGRGFGLATVQGDVLRCGGTIFCDTEPGKGTEFRIYFKRAS
ncbi:MAG TPA: ATP-binding protein [Kiritimatiellia bacterium]